MKRKIILLLATMIFIQVLFGMQVFTESPISVVVNGDNISFDTPPIIENGRTLVPLRKIFESLGAQVTWNANTRSLSRVVCK
jgi:hypothetical protein